MFPKFPFRLGRQRLFASRPGIARAGEGGPGGTAGKLVPPLGGEGEKHETAASERVEDLGPGSRSRAARNQYNRA